MHMQDNSFVFMAGFSTSLEKIAQNVSACLVSVFSLFLNMNDSCLKVYWQALATKYPHLHMSLRVRLASLALFEDRLYICCIIITRK